MPQDHATTSYQVIATTSQLILFSHDHATIDYRMIVTQMMLTFMTHNHVTIIEFPLCIFTT